MLQRLALLAVLVTGLPAGAQFAQDDRLEAPRTPAEYWRAVTFELNTGKYDAAAFYVKGFLASNPTEDNLIELEARDGLAAFLRLRNVAKWSTDAKINEEAKKNAEEVITRVTKALEARLGNQGRINRLVAALNGSPEERAFALTEVQRSGARAVPALVAALRADTDPTARATILNALPSLPEGSVAPLLASLDMSDAQLRLQILESLGRRADFPYLPAKAELNPLPTLDYFASSPDQPAGIRDLARTLITRLRPVARSEVRPGKLELVDAALRFHRHQERFIKPDTVNVWRWENNDLAVTPSNVSQAEEYFGLRYARWALELDPEFLPAQVAFLSIAADKAVGRAGPAADIAKAEPAVHELISKASGAALIATLDQALADQRTNVALAITRILGERADVRAAQPGRYRAGALVRALDYPDRRVQHAAASALVRMPGPYAAQNQTRIVEILRRSLASQSETLAPGKPRVLVGHFDPIRGAETANTLRAAGFDAVSVRTGREVTARLRQAADIDLVVIDAAIPYPPLPDLLANLRYDVHHRTIPVRVVYTPGSPPPVSAAAMEERLGRSTQHTVAVAVAEDRAAFDSLNRVRALTAGLPGVELLMGPITPDQAQSALTRGVSEEPTAAVAEEERKRFASESIQLLRHLAEQHAGIDLKPADSAVRQSLRVEELTIAAAAVAARLPGRDAQSDLATVVLDSKRKVETRAFAADQLILHVQRFGAALPADSVTAFVELSSTNKEPALRGRLAAIVGILSGDGKTTGQRLKRFVPPTPVAAPAKTAAPEGEKPADGEKKPQPETDDK
jgi:CheY-like chemotaxis protein